MNFRCFNLDGVLVFNLNLILFFLIIVPIL